jgi:2-methylcitrate dehydratase PrpD
VEGLVTTRRIRGVTEALVDSIIKIRFGDLSKEDINTIKLMLLDSVGCALGSYVSDRSKFAIELTKEFGGNSQATIIGSHLTSYALAAFANGELINSLDYEILGPLSGHICPYVTPSCLAIAEKVHASGKELIIAVALAHEIGGRILSSLAQHKILIDEPPYYEDAQRFSYAETIFGGVAGACKLLRLEPLKTLNALGIAGATTPVPAVMKWQYTSGPAIMVKYNAWSGWVSQLATVAALLAEKGLTGDTTILDGEWGFWKIVGSPFFNVENLLEGLGKVWHVKEIDFKPYPTCRLNHAGIEGINRIMQQHEVKPEEIEEITVRGDPLLKTPNRMNTEVESFVDLQFSNVNVFSLAAFYGNSPSPAWQMPVTYDNPRIKGLSKKVKIETHPRSENLITSRIRAGKLPVFWDTIVEITDRGGKKFTTEITTPKGTPDNPMTETELVEKFRNNASYSILASSRVEQIIEIMKCLEKVDDVTELTRLLRTSPGI